MDGIYDVGACLVVATVVRLTMMCMLWYQNRDVQVFSRKQLVEIGFFVADG